MRNEHIFTALSVLVLGWLLAVPAQAYKPETHQVMSRQALQRSDAGKTSQLYGVLGISYTDAWSAIGTGAEDEDNLINGLNHFFNPRSKTGLTNGKSLSSPEWILNNYRDPCIHTPGTRAGFVTMQDCFYLALTAQQKSDRADHARWMFMELGHVIHHIQDMAQPEHTRLDEHCDKLICAARPGIGTGSDTRNAYSPSDYEDRSHDNEALIAASDASLLAGLQAVYSRSDPNPSYRVPLDFWTTSDNKGMADYSSTNFTSRYRNFVRCDKPNDTRGYCNLNDPSVVPRLLDRSNPYDLPTPDATKTTTKLMPSPEGTLTDYVLNGSGVPLARRWSFGVRPGDFLEQDKVVLDAYFKKLVPMAIAYSAGMINFHFRGDMTMSQSDTGTLTLTNYSPSDMEGRFELYWDDVNGVRQSTHVIWNGAITSKGQVDLGSVTIPSAIALVNTSNRYILVFKGKIGPLNTPLQVEQVAGKIVTLLPQSPTQPPSSTPPVGTPITITVVDVQNTPRCSLWAPERSLKYCHQQTVITISCTGGCHNSSGYPFLGGVVEETVTRKFSGCHITSTTVFGSTEADEIPVGGEYDPKTGNIVVNASIYAIAATSDLRWDQTEECPSPYTDSSSAVFRLRVKDVLTGRLSNIKEVLVDDNISLHHGEVN